MKRANLLLLLVLLAFGLSTLFVSSCISGSEDDDDSGDDDDTGDDDDDSGDDDDDSTEYTWEGDQTVTVEIDGNPTDVDLLGLDAFMWTDPDDGLDKLALLVQTVVDEAVETKDDIEDYKFNFIASDAYSLLSKQDGDYRTLPGYDQLDQGWFIEYEEEGSKATDIRVIWDESLGYPNAFSARLMDGGTIQTVENILFDEHVTVSVDYASAKAYTAVDLFGMPAFDNEGVMCVYLHFIILDADLEEFDPKTKDYAFNFISNDADGNYDLLVEKLGGDTGLLPVWKDYEESKDIHHGWIYDDSANDNGYRLDYDEATGFENMYKSKHMDDGYIEVHDITVE